jgi:hypothetical protein
MEKCKCCKKWDAATLPGQVTPCGCHCCWMNDSGWIRRKYRHPNLPKDEYHPGCNRARVEEKKQRREKGYVPACGDCAIGICTQNPNTCPFVQEHWGPKEDWPRPRVFEVKNGRRELVD